MSNKYSHISTGHKNTYNFLIMVSKNITFTKSYIIEDGTEELYYTITDYLGSILMLTDKYGNIEEETNYDAWGRVRNPDNWDTWTYANAQPLTKIFRGYTGHEMLPHFALINMNGRMYDKILSRMLSRI